MNDSLLQAVVDSPHHTETRWVYADHLAESLPALHRVLMLEEQMLEEPSNGEVRLAFAAGISSVDREWAYAALRPYDIELVDSPRSVATIQQVMKLRALRLREGKALWDQRPSRLLEGVNLVEAVAVEELLATTCEASIRISPGRRFRSLSNSNHEELLLPDPLPKEVCRQIFGRREVLFMPTHRVRRFHLTGSDEGHAASSQPVVDCLMPSEFDRVDLARVVVHARWLGWTAERGGSAKYDVLARRVCAGLRGVTYIAGTDERDVRFCERVAHFFHGVSVIRVGADGVVLGDPELGAEVVIVTEGRVSGSRLLALCHGLRKAGLRVGRVHCLVEREDSELLTSEGLELVCLG